MKLSTYILGVLMASSVVSSTYAADISGLNKNMTYQEIKTWHEQFLSGEPTKAERLEAMRSMIRNRFGERGLNRIYRNFEGNYSIDPRIPGVENSVLLQMSPSKSQVKGYRRELLYATQLYNDPRFSLVALNRNLGDTDADIVFRHKATGLYGRIEVKDHSLDSQRINLRKIKIQMDKMAKEARLTGQPQFWLNRRDVHPTVEKYGSAKGIYVLGNVKTGRASNGIPFREANGMFEQEYLRVDRARTILASGSFAFGAWMLMDAAPNTWEDIQTVWNPDTRTPQAWLRFGEHSSYALAGGGMALSGGAQTAGKYVSEGLQGRLYYLGRSSGIASVAALGLGEVFLISRYATGDVSSREFWTTQWIMGTTGAGSLTGGIAGHMMRFVPVYGPFLGVYGPFLGSVGGTWVGNQIGQRTADEYYDFKFRKLDQEYGEFVYARYGIK